MWSTIGQFVPWLLSNNIVNYKLYIYIYYILLLLLLSDLGNARVIIEAVLLIETITPFTPIYK